MMRAISRRALTTSVPLVSLLIALGVAPPTAHAVDEFATPRPRVATTPTVGIRVSEVQVLRAPNVIGQPVASARVILERGRLRAGRETPQPTSEHSAGTVMGQDPKPGTVLQPGASVNLWVATPPQRTEVIVPNLIGQSAEVAAAVLAKPGLSLGDRRRHESDATAGAVIAQFPAAGTRVRPGTSVDVTIAAPALVAVPDLTGETPREAARVLHRYQLALGQEHRRESEAPAGTVIRQSPAAGTRVPRETPVNVLVATAPPAPVPPPTSSTPPVPPRPPIVIAPPVVIAPPIVIKPPVVIAPPMIVPPVVIEPPAPPVPPVATVPPPTAPVVETAPQLPPAPPLATAPPAPPVVTPQPLPPAPPVATAPPTPAAPVATLPPAPAAVAAAPPAPAPVRKPAPKPVPPNPDVPKTPEVPPAPAPAPPPVVIQTPPQPDVQPVRESGKPRWPKPIAWGLGSMVLLGAGGTAYYRVRTTNSVQPVSAVPTVKFDSHWDAGTQQIEATAPLSNSSGLRLVSGVETAITTLETDHLVGSAHDRGGIR